ncbi:MAG: hypothetical protein IPJ65_25465 [Archangiaceae bacterium]|nr:hypothetical protein [Archangiaceae bacterium]
MNQKAVMHDVKRASHQAGLIGWNEIGPERYFTAIKKLGPGWAHYMPRHGKEHIPVPISWKKSEWKLVSAGNMLTHGGLARVSPNRYITWVKLKKQSNPGKGQEIVRINTHLVSGAFSGKSHHAWRLSHWKIHQQKLAALVDKFKAQGLEVVVGGDFNRDGAKVLGNHVAYDNSFHVGTHGKRTTYDYLMHAGDLQKVEAHVHRKYRSDHDAVVASYRFRHIKA